MDGDVRLSMEVRNRIMLAHLCIYIVLLTCKNIQCFVVKTNLLLLKHATIIWYVKRMAGSKTPTTRTPPEQRNTAGTTEHRRNNGTPTEQHRRVTCFGQHGGGNKVRDENHEM